jgi:hypothetical protein
MFDHAAGGGDSNRVTIRPRGALRSGSDTLRGKRTRPNCLPGKR